MIELIDYQSIAQCTYAETCTIAMATRDNVILCVYTNVLTRGRPTCDNWHNDTTLGWLSKAQSNYTEGNTGYATLFVAKFVSHRTG